MNETEAPYMLKCECGNVIPSHKKARWCLECGNQVFADPTARFRSKANRIYMQGIVLCVILFLGYLIVETVHMTAT